MEVGDRASSCNWRVGDMNRQVMSLRDWRHSEALCRGMISADTL